MIKSAEAGIIEFTELGERLGDPVRTYSTRNGSTPCILDFIHGAA